jgi:hypothetical protein
VYQHTLHPEEGNTSRMYGIKGPNRRRPTLQPLTRMPAAKPRRFEANQTDARAIMGTLDPALPAPVRLRIIRATSKEFDSPVRMSPMATTAKEMEMICREPSRVAKYPPSKEKTK